MGNEAQPTAISPERTLIHQEAAEAAEVAERQLGGLRDTMRNLGFRLRALDPLMVLTCARGSSDHAATYAKYLIETRAGVPVASFAPSTSSVYRTAWRPLDRALFLVISQSGRSPDLILSAQAARAAGALVVAIVNEPDTPLAQAADVAIPMLAGPERSVAATKSFIASLLIIGQVVAAWREDGELGDALGATPTILRGAWALDWSAALPVLRDARSLYVLGRGLTLAAAQEAALKLKETCGIHAEAASAAEVKHGPMALVGPDFPVLMLAPNDAGDALLPALARDFSDRGGCVMMAGAEEEGALLLPVLADLHPALAPIAAIQSFYRLAAELSIMRGFDPDRPPHLQKVTQTR